MKSQRWRAGMHGVIFEVKTKLLQGYSPFLLFFLQVPQGASPASSRGTYSPLKTPPSKEASSVTTASSPSPIRPPGAALDGNCTASSLLFPSVQLIHFKVPFFFFFLKFRGTNVSLYIQFSGYATCMNQTFNHLLEGLWRCTEFMTGEA